MKIPDTYMGGLRYRKVETSFATRFEDRVMQEMEDRSQDGGTYSINLVMVDHEEIKSRSLPYVDATTLDRATDWFHEIQEGVMFKVVFGNANEPPNLALDPQTFED